MFVFTLQASHQELNRQQGVFLLDETMSTVSKLQIVLEATTTAFDNGLKKATVSLQGFAKKTDEIHSKMDKFARKNRDALDGIQAAGATAVAGLAAIGFAVKGAVDEAVKFESAMAGVKKVIDFDTPEAFKQMGDDIIRLSQEIPMAADGLADIMASAGQAGIAQQELFRFTETAAKMGVAFEISAQEAGQAMAEMRVAFKMSQDEVEVLADKINYLGNTSPNNAAKIMEITQAVGAVAELGGFAADQVAALSSVIVGIDPSSVATGMKNISLRLTEGANATKAQRAAFERLGLSAEDVAKRMKEDAVGTLMEVTRLISETIPEHEQSAISKMLVGQEALPVFAQLVQNQDIAIQKLKDMGDASKYAGSMLKEFAAVAETSQAQMQIFGNNITAVKIALGAALLPAINSVMQALTPMLQAFTEWASANPQMVATITAITAGALGLVTVLGGLALAFTAVTSGIGAVLAIGTMVGGFMASISSAVSVVTMFGGALAALGFPVTAVVAGITALVVAGVALYKNWDEVKAAAITLKDTVLSTFDSLKSEAMTKFNELKSSLTAIFDSLPAPARTALSAIGAVFGTQFGVIKAVVSTHFAFIKNIFTTTFAVIKSLVRGDINGVKTAIQNGMSQLGGIARNAMGQMLSAVLSIGARLRQAGGEIVQGLINGISDKIESAVAKVREMASRMKNAVTGFFDINSPSRVMKQIGEWVSEGLAIGIAAKAPLAAKEAAKLAEDAKKAFDDEIKSLDRNILIASLKLKGDPNAEFTADVISGKYGDPKSEKMQQLYDKMQQSLDLSQQVKAAESFNAQISDLRRQVELMGVNNPIEQLEYDLINTDKYAGYTTEQINQLKTSLQDLEDAKSLNAFNAELEKATAEMAKQEYLLKNIGDKYASLKYDLSQKGFSESQIAQLVGVQQRTDTINAFAKQQEGLRSGTVFSLPTFSGSGIQGAGNALAAGIQGYSELNKQYQAQLDIIKNARQAQLDINADYDQQERDLLAAHEAAKLQLTLSSAEHITSGLEAATKSMFGEQSKAYRMMFAAQKGAAITSAAMSIKTAISKAFGHGITPFDRAVAVAQAAAQGAKIIADIKAIREPVIGQAHDGIMSVPKSGTWNLEKGERVLPKHTAQNLDNTLNRLQGRGEAKVIINNYTSEKASVDKQPNGDLIVTLGKLVDSRVDQKLAQERRQGGLLYGR